MQLLTASSVPEYFYRATVKELKKDLEQVLKERAQNWHYIAATSLSENNTTYALLRTVSWSIIPKTLWSG